ncbi:VOC family protein [Carboxylicivirga taeanensis]|uniref:VOC family protein n=1 Tax=Carboxylicivirga taeanensis TaxID=1416875 RepID=UPI003F6E2684
MNKLITWVEIPVVNMNRAVLFYNEVFKLALKVQDFGHEQMAFFPNNEGALSKAADFNPSKEGSLITFYVPDSIDATISRIEKAKGIIAKPKTKIEAEGLGYFALFIDCEGNKVGIYGDK